MHGDEPPPDAELRGFAGSGGVSALAVELRHLLALAVAAIPSCIGVSLVLRTAAPSVTLSVLRPGWGEEAVLASMSVGLPRPLIWPTDGGAELLVYAAAQHAFRDMVPSVLALLDLQSRRITLDEHLQAPNLAEERAGLTRWLDEQLVVDRALGILLEQGLLPEDGRRELARLADFGGTSPFTAAQALIASTTTGLEG